MWKSLTALAVITTAAATPAQAQSRRAIGVETTIDYAGGAGIRDWERGPRGSKLVYLQDRALRWYRVTLSGDCLDQPGARTLIYRTDNGGRLDRFATVAPANNPGLSCRVESIKTSLAPPNRKARKG